MSTDAGPLRHAPNVAAPPERPQKIEWHSSVRAYLQQLPSSDFVRKVTETYTTQIMLLAVGLLTSITVARILGPQGRGLYSVAMAMGVIGVQLGNVGMHASNTYYLAQDGSLLPRLLSNSLAVSLGLGGGLAAFALVIFTAWPSLSPIPGPLMWLGAVWVPVGLAYLLAENLLLALQDVRSYNKVELLNRILALCLVGGVILVHRTTPESVLAAMLVSMLISIGWMGSRFVLLIDRFPRPSLRLLRSHFGLGIKAYLIALFGFLLLRIDLLMVKYILGAEQAGYYSVASTMADYILMLPSVIGLILFPRLSGIRGRKEKFRQARKVAVGTAFALAPILALAAMAAKPVVRILFGLAFLPAAAAFLWLIPGIFTMGVEIALVQYLNSIGYPQVLVWTWLLSVILNFALNFWAIPVFGIAGASAVSSLSYTLVFLAVLIVVRRTRTGNHDRLVVV